MSDNPLDSILDDIEDGRSEPTPIDPFADMPKANANPTPQAESSQATDNVGGFEASPNADAIPMAKNPAGSGLLDSAGVEWNPSVHTTNQTKTVTGKWRKRKGMGNVNPAPVPLDGQRIACRKAAEQTCGQMFVLASAFGGPHWMPTLDVEHGIDERQIMVDAWTEFFVDYGIVKMPSWLAVTVVMGAYSVPRFIHPDTQVRIEGMKEWWNKRKKKPVKEKSNDPLEPGRPPTDIPPPSNGFSRKPPVSPRSTWQAPPEKIGG